MYAIVIENCIEEGYWTEKLVDSLLLKCVVFYWGAPDVHSWFLPESVIPFSSLEDLVALLDSMSTADYSAKAEAVELNFHRAQAWTHMDDGILLETDFLSTAPFRTSACKCGKEEAYISATLMGGLGNQLFQMAAAFGLESAARISAIHMPSISSTTLAHTTERYTDTIFASWPQTDLPFDAVHTEAAEDAFTHRAITPTGRHFHLHGYFQQELYISHRLAAFARRLKLPEGAAPPAPDTCFIHLRYGDYLVHTVHALDLITHYLPAAMSLQRERRPGVRFLVFSDDVERCKGVSWLQASDVAFSEESDAVRALVRMSQCEAGGICSNSSFGWWGAYLNANPAKVVTFPRKWMHNNWGTHIQFAGSVLIDHESAI